MDPFAGVLPFVRVAESLSFTAAARRLGVSTAAVSKAVARLEASLGVRLLQRTSRSVALTPEGRALLEHAGQAVGLLEAGRERVTQAQKVPRGQVTLSAPPIVAPVLTAGVAQLLTRYPQVGLHLSLTDHVVRLASEAVDVAVRMGPLTADSQVHARLLRTTGWVTLASPAWLARHGVPRTPQDLVGRPCIRFVTPRGAPRNFSFATRGTRSRPLAVDGPVTVDHGDALMPLACQGLGVVQVLDFMVADHVRSGALVEVLLEYQAPGPPLHVLTLAGRRASPRIRAVVDWLVQVVGTAPGAGA